MDKIHENDELEKYWQEAEKKNEVARRAARKLEKERRRLQLGSDYETTGSTDEDPFAMDSDLESEYEEEESENESDEGLTEDEIAQKHKLRREAKEAERRKQEEEERLKRFNPIKFLAEALKQISKKGQASEGSVSQNAKEPDSPI